MNTNAWKSLWHQPVFSAILEKRRAAAVLAGLGVVHIGLNLAGLSFWSCPILSATGVPCPGCGLTRAVMQLLHGDVAASLQTHAFAPVALAALLLAILALVLPELTRAKLIGFIRGFETRNGLAAWGGLLWMLYWAARLLV